jgi:hypothetical protein
MSLLPLPAMIKYNIYQAFVIWEIVKGYSKIYLIIY